MTDAASGPVLAAGAVCWRRRHKAIEILLISRPRHGDVSLPKGKVDPGESLPEAAVREISEETGFAVTLGMPLGTAQYTLPGGRDKTVVYWAAKVPKTELERGRFSPNAEVDEIEWVPLAKARRRLTYERDGEVVQRFAELAVTGDLDSFRLIVLRHAKAEFDSPSGLDADRQLTTRGRAQARAVVPALAAWGPTRIGSSPAARCLATVAPFAKASGIPVKEVPAISQEGWERSGHDASGIRAYVERRVGKGRTTVICSHAPVLPEILEQIAEVTGSPNGGRMTRAGILATAEFTVVHLASAAPHRILAMETYAVPE
ncbi:NUDIX domain-containing protein [Amnibacterium sp. CER49]|uniref:NUDIX hydrolase n=1 Tax=Amnibacterium sp. CER49 TaxID=3039161 RepID=UPI00244A34B7|nr:NUDIX domain-containing protein [Amnibacterium sp. CER49]MDH2444119.1 NUDIX domain-containing protein [Amnibacterium sp. CER49]